MKQLLRSCFIASSDSPARIMENFLAFRDAGLEEFDFPEDHRIWDYIKDFVERYGHIPDEGTLLTHFRQAKEDHVLERLGELQALQSLARGDFVQHLEVKADDRRFKQASNLLQEAATVLKTGLEIKDEHGKVVQRLKGPIDMMSFLFDRGHSLVMPVGASRLSGDVTADGDDAIAEYERIEADPLHGMGQHTGIQQMDVALNGAKKGELWIHAAFTGGLKSTLALNWAYNQAVFYHKDVLFFSLEMPYPQCRRILYAMHSYHPKFRAIRHRLGLQADPNADIGLPYEAIRDGWLKKVGPNAKQFFTDYVVPDLNRKLGLPYKDEEGNEHSSDYGRIFIEVADPEKPDFTVADLRMKADLIYSKTHFKTIFVDHAGLMSPRKWVASTTDRLNEVLRDLKKLALGFHRGEGIAVVALFQIGREGYKAALKLKEKGGKPRYELPHLSYANEAERSGDVVTAGWMDDDLRKANRYQIQNLKSRDQAPFEIFQARVEWPCRRILTCFDVEMTAEQKAKAGDEIDAAVAALG